MAVAPLLRLPFDESWVRSVPIDPFDVARTRKARVLTTSDACRLVDTRTTRLAREAAAAIKGRIGTLRGTDVNVAALLESLLADAGRAATESADSDPSLVRAEALTAAETTSQFSAARIELTADDLVELSEDVGLSYAGIDSDATTQLVACAAVASIAVECTERGAESACNVGQVRAAAPVEAASRQAIPRASDSTRRGAWLSVPDANAVALEEAIASENTVARQSGVAVYASPWAGNEALDDRERDSYSPFALSIDGAPGCDTGMAGLAVHSVLAAHTPLVAGPRAFARAAIGSMFALSAIAGVLAIGFSATSHAVDSASASSAGIPSSVSPNQVTVSAAAPVNEAPHRLARLGVAVESLPRLR